MNVRSSSGKSQEKDIRIRPTSFPWRSIQRASVSRYGMVSTAHHRATDIGIRVLEKGGNAMDAALVAGLVALEPRDSEFGAFRVPSPLQSSAHDYGSSFSRAVEVDCPDHRRLYVSGTASIDKAGNTIFLDDCRAQVAKTMEVVQAILESRQMGWEDVTRALAYFKRAKDAPLLAAYRQENNLPPFPVIVAENDVCRDDLLFEIEIDAVQTK